MTYIPPITSQEVSGTVDVGNFPAVQPVSDNGSSITVDGSVAVTTLPVGQQRKAQSTSVVFASDQEPSKSTFGDTLTSELRPHVTLKATYGMTDAVKKWEELGATATSSDAKFIVNSGTTSGAFAQIWSAKPVVYVPGLGAEARLTAHFDTPVADSVQAAGFYSLSDGMLVGYNGTSFGFMHRQGGSWEVRTVTVTAGASGGGNATVTLNGVAYTCAVTAGTPTQNAHEIKVALDASAAANLWYFQHIGTTVSIIARSPSAMAGAFSFTGFGTLTGTNTQVKAGAAPTETWIPRANWNCENADWLNPANGNLYKFEFAYLGYGPLKFSVFNPSIRAWTLAHIIDYSNTSTTVNLGNPSLRIGWFVKSNGSTTELEVVGASGFAGTQGRPNGGRHFGQYGIASGVTTETQIFTIASRYEYGGRRNLGLIIPHLLTASTDSTKGAIFKIYMNPVIGGVDAHAYVDQTESIALYDTAGTTVSGGRLISVITCGPQGRVTIDLESLDIAITTGEELVVTAQVTTGAASDMTAAITWHELI